MIDQFNMENICLLKEMGYEVHVACNFKEGNTCDEGRLRRLRETLCGMQVRQHQWDCPRSICALNRCCRAFYQLWELTGKHQFDWIHCHSPIGGALARVAGHMRRIRVIYTVHGFHFYQGAPIRNWLVYYPIEKLLSYWTDVLITVNQEDFQLAANRMRAGKVYRIPGVGISVRRFQGNKSTDECSRRNRKAFRAKYGIPDEAVVFLSVGELSRRKNHQAVIEALAGIPRQDVYYLICGQGSQKNRILHTARRYGMTHRIRLTGFLEDISAAYQSADLFVFPSLQEGLPAALMEAMAAGLPCVVSDIRGNRELISQKGGRRFPAAARKMMGLGQSNEKLVRYLKEFLDDKTLWKACGYYNQKKAEAYDTTVVQRHMKQIYGEAFGLKKQFIHKKGAKEKKPEVSVIMAVHNASDGKSLRAAAASICAQTYTSWELLICDDGSTDGTWEILQKIAQKDSRIRLLRLEHNRKAAAARNVCLKKAQGRYIAVMDADDISSPDRLERLYYFLESHPQFAFAGSRGEFFVRRPGDDGECYWYCQVPGEEDFLFSLPFVHASIMFRREPLIHVHGYKVSRRVVRAEDYDLLLRLYGAGYCGANLEQVLYYIRRDREQYKRRRYRYRFHEAYVKYKGFSELGLMPKGLVYVVKPFFVGLVPYRLAAVMQKRYYKEKSNKERL